MSGVGSHMHADRSVENVWVRFVAALALVGMLCVGSFALLHHLTGQQASNAPTINVSGRQRMLSQRIAKLAFQMAHARDREAREMAQSELLGAIDLMRRSHEALTRGDASMQVSSSLSAAMQEHYFGAGGLDAMVRAYLAHASAVGASHVLAYDDPDLAAIATLARGPLLESLDQAVSQYEVEASAQVDELEAYALALMLATLALLIVEGVVIRPVARRLAEQVQTILGSEAALRDRDRALQQVLDSTGDALLSVSLEGRILRERSRAVEAWFGTPAPDQPLSDFLFWKDDDPSAVMMDVGFDQLATEALPLDVALLQLPERLVRGARVFELSYRPTLDEGGNATAVLVVIRDVTAEVERRRAEEAMKELHAVGRRMMADPLAFRLFVKETGILVESLGELGDDRTRLLRTLHTLKGNAGIYGLVQLGAVAHEAESQVLFEAFGASREALDAVRTTWNDTLARLDVFLDDGRDAELVQIFRAEYAGFVRTLRSSPAYAPLLAEVTRWTGEHAARPGGHVLRLAAGLATRQGKELVTDLHGGQERLPRDRFATFWQTMVHVLRNAVEHGIEAPEDREALGKPAAGRVVLSVRRRDEEVEVRVSDDGRGIEWDRLRDKALAAGLRFETPQDQLAALVAPGISSRDVVTELSGRGMGTAAVHDAVLALGGTMHVESEAGRGTTFAFVMPLQERPSLAA